MCVLTPPFHLHTVLPLVAGIVAWALLVSAVAAPGWASDDGLGEDSVSYAGDDGSGLDHGGGEHLHMECSLSECCIVNVVGFPVSSCLGCTCLGPARTCGVSASSIHHDDVGPRHGGVVEWVFTCTLIRCPLSLSLRVAVGANHLRDSGTLDFVYLSFIARLAFGLAITLLSVSLVIPAVSNCHTRVYARRHLPVNLAIAAG